MLEKIGLKVLNRMDPELAHNLALSYLKLPFYSFRATPKYQTLRTQIAGIDVPNPVGLAAGFDKNGVAIQNLSRIGLGFIEIGAVTPHPQPGNPRPRVFRINSEQAIINHYGFNNDGMKKINYRLQKFAKKAVVGLNIGANRDSPNMINDFVTVLKFCVRNIHFATVNVSSPNTKNLRSFQGRKKLDELLAFITATNKNFKNPIPIFIKIAPDLNLKQIEAVAELSEKHNISGIIATNTSTDQQILNSFVGYSKGGISGKPLFAKSTKILAYLSIITEGKIPLIGVGGISSGSDAFEKICAGATVVQLYSALAFCGPNLISKILHDLNEQLKINGYNHISEAVGTKKYDYA